MSSLLHGGGGGGGGLEGSGPGMRLAPACEGTRSRPAREGQVRADGLCGARAGHGLRGHETKAKGRGLGRALGREEHEGVSRTAKEEAREWMGGSEDSVRCIVLKRLFRLLACV